MDKNHKTRQEDNAITFRINQEIKFLYRKKDQI